MMGVNTGEVVKLLSEGYKDAPFIKDVLQHAADSMRNDPPQYQEFRQQLCDTGNLDIARFDKEVAQAAQAQPKGSVSAILSQFMVTDADVKEIDTAKFIIPDLIIEG